MDSVSREHVISLEAILNRQEYQKFKVLIVGCWARSMVEGTTFCHHVVGEEIGGRVIMLAGGSIEIDFETKFYNPIQELLDVTFNVNAIIWAFTTLFIQTSHDSLPGLLDPD